MFRCRLDDIVKTKEDSEYSRLSHYNKGLKLLTETLKSEKTRPKGETTPKICMYLPSCAFGEYLQTRRIRLKLWILFPQLLPGVSSESCWRGRTSSAPFPCLYTTVVSQPLILCPVLEQYVYHRVQMQHKSELFYLQIVVTTGWCLRCT